MRGAAQHAEGRYNLQTIIEINPDVVAPEGNPSGIPSATC
jgi:hypothetical protein